MLKAGDKVVGKPDIPYRITSEGSVCKVLSVFDNGMMVVKLLQPGKKSASERDIQRAIKSAHGFSVEQSDFLPTESGNKSLLSLLHKEE